MGSHFCKKKKLHKNQLGQDNSKFFIPKIQQLSKQNQNKSAVEQSEQDLKQKSILTKPIHPSFNSKRFSETSISTNTQITKKMRKSAAPIFHLDQNKKQICKKNNEDASQTQNKENRNVLNCRLDPKNIKIQNIQKVKFCKNHLFNKMQLTNCSAILNSSLYQKKSNYSCINEDYSSLNSTMYI